MLLFSLLLLYFSIITAKGTNEYFPDWKSLDSRPLPLWYDEAKIGIFIHWGVFSVPSFKSEWFWYDWIVEKEGNCTKFMEENYPPGFTYQDFGNQFKAEFFNASDWAQIFKSSGAKYVVLTSKHHEGYTLWPSKYSFSWNAKDVGPHKDLIGIFKEAIKNKTDLKFGLYHSLYEWFNPLWLQDKSNNFTTNEFSKNKVLPEMKELINTYEPELLWSDGEWEASDDYWFSKQFLAWLYNESPVKDTIVVNDRWGHDTLCNHGGFLTCQDRYFPGKLLSRKWENAMTLDKTSWGFRRNAKLEDFFTNYELISLLAQTISFGGNFLVNVGPTKEGIIPPIFQDRLKNMGDWLKVNGEAIYESKPWEKCQNDTLTPNVWYTTKFDKYINKRYLYAMISNWPKEGRIKLKCPKISGNKAVINMLGVDLNLQWNQQDRFLEVVFPNKEKTTNDYVWTLRIDADFNEKYMLENEVFLVAN
uniref:Putative alpha-L-fucosidase n=2 Tax=Clastoptera arizonana TaxID=38151 RepID=A0A1B6D5J4_9HEMI